MFSTCSIKSHFCLLAFTCINWTKNHHLALLILTIFPSSSLLSPFHLSYFHPIPFHDLLSHSIRLFTIKFIFRFYLLCLFLSPPLPSHYFSFCIYRCACVYIYSCVIVCVYVCVWVCMYFPVVHIIGAHDHWKPGSKKRSRHLENFRNTIFLYTT